MDQPSTDSVTVVVLDASVLINFLIVDRLDLLGRLETYRFVTPEDVLEEIEVEPQRRAFGTAVEQGVLRVERITAISELRTRIELRRVLGKGEAACLAMAQHRGWMIACDERRRFLRICRERLGPNRILTTPDLMLAAIQDSLITWRQADLLKARLERQRFRMPFTSFRELLNKE